MGETKTIPECIQLAIQGEKIKFKFMNNDYYAHKFIEHLSEMRIASYTLSFIDGDYYFNLEKGTILIERIK